MSQDLAAAYQRLEQAIDEVARIEGAEGVLTEWAVVFATQRFADDGGSISQVGRLLPGDSRMPYHRILGLLDYVQTLIRAEITTPDDEDGNG